MHAGHVRYLRAAREWTPSTEALRVAIAPDDYIRTAKHRAPHWSQADRAETVFALGCVDAVILQQEESAAELIRTLKPRRFIKGLDWRDRLPEAVLAACYDVGTELVFVNTPGVHVREALR